MNEFNKISKEIDEFMTLSGSIADFRNLEINKLIAAQRVGDDVAMSVAQHFIDVWQKILDDNGVKWDAKLLEMKQWIDKDDAQKNLNKIDDEDGLYGTKEQIEDFDLAIGTAEDIKVVYKDEMEYEFSNTEDEINYNLIVSHHKKIDALDVTIEIMKKKRADLEKILYLKNGDAYKESSDKEENRMISDYIFTCECLGREEAENYHTDLGRNDSYLGEEFSDSGNKEYGAWRLDEQQYLL